MAKRKSDTAIGQRCATYILLLHPEVKKACALVGIKRQCFYEWKNGQSAPSAYHLQALAYHGADVHYLLTGRRQTKLND